MTTRPRGLHRSTAGLLAIELPTRHGIHSFELDRACVAFYNGTTQTEAVTTCVNWAIHRAVHTMHPGFTHTELAFHFVSEDKRSECWMSCCIYRNTALHFEAKTGKYFTEHFVPAWTVLQLVLKKPTLEQLLLDCVNDVQLGLAFNETFWWNFLMPFRFCRTRGQLRQSTWCSEHVAFRLARLDICAFAAPERLTPQAIYDCLIENGCTQYTKG